MGSDVLPPRPDPRPEHREHQKQQRIRRKSIRHPYLALQFTLCAKFLSSNIPSWSPG